MTLTKARTILENKSDYTVQEVRDAKKKVAEMKKGGMPMKKIAMMRGGMANKKEHMYAAGGSVMDNLTSGQKKMVMSMAKANKK
jgi:hypothetical protein